MNIQRDRVLKIQEKDHDLIDVLVTMNSPGYKGSVKDAGRIFFFKYVSQLGKG